MYYIGTMSDEDADPQKDIWIAATAFETSSRILSYDNHFDRIDGLGRFAP